MGKRAEAERVGLRYLSSAYQLRRMLDERMIAGGLSLSRTKMLQVLELRGPIRQAVLAEALDLAPRSVTQTVESLERDGLIKRRRDPGDHRGKLVALTPAGSSALAAGAAAGEQVLQQIFGALHRKQLADLDDLLGVIEIACAGVGQSTTT